LPHLIVEYSANIEDQIALDALLDKLHACALGTGVFPLGGLRVRAHRADAYRIADKAPENGFVHVTALIGHGRPLDVQQRAAEELFAVLTAHLAPLFARSPLAPRSTSGIPSGAELASTTARVCRAVAPWPHLMRCADGIR
jgi:5-carboxymethyl-2-hydroxymuconate isomerase